MYNFVTKDYGLTEIDIIIKNVLDKFWTVLDMSKRQWELDTMDMSKTSFGHVQLSNIIKSNWTCPKDSPGIVYIYNHYLLNKLQFIIKINGLYSWLSKVLIFTRYHKKMSISKVVDYIPGYISV